MQFTTLTAMCPEVLECILTEVIGQNTYSIGGLIINKHIYSVANTLWFAMVRGRLKFAHVNNIQEMVALLYAAQLPDTMSEVGLYTNDDETEHCDAELRLQINELDRCIYTRHYCICYSDVDKNNDEGPRFTPWDYYYTRTAEYMSVEYIALDEHVQSESSLTHRRNMGQMMHRILPELAGLFSY